MKLSIRKSELCKETTIKLPTSKSISNRALMIQALCESDFLIKNLSTSNDTSVLNHALNSTSHEIDIEDAGTAARFILPYLCTKKGVWTLRGTARMHERPIAPLVDALRSLGANISYLEKENYLPLQIVGGDMQGGKVSIDASMSSQFASALLLLAPTLALGLSIQIEALKHSKPYLDMTMELMRYFGISIQEEGDIIHIVAQKYKAVQLSIESDWSAASYFFFAASLIPGSRIQLNNLSVYSWQGDSTCSYLSSLLGGETHLLGDNIAVRYETTTPNLLEIDFKDIPDLVMTFAVWCCAKKVNARFSNIDNLKHKESDRLTSLQTELKKLNCDFYKSGEYWILQPDQAFNFNTTITIQTYNDHRMAMAFAPLSVLLDGIIIEDAQVVSKSFPTFWDEWKKLGFDIIELPA